MSQNSEPPPVQENDPKEMQMVLATYKTTPFQLPSDWVVEVRPRGPQSSVSSDKYYYEPGTGRKFRSLASVKRHLFGEEDPTPTRKPRPRPSNSLVPYNNNKPAGTVKRICYGGKVLTPEELEEARYTNLEDIEPETSQFRLANTLPDGWIVEDVPRKLGSNIRSDRYYIDPATGQRFRSMPEVQRFLGTERCNKPKRKALALNSRCTAPRSPVPRKKNTSITTFKDTLLDLMSPPKKINWVYSGDGKDNWSPLVEECVLPNYVMEQWSETFLLGMNGRKDGVPLLTMEEHNQG
ncbi:methyl-CpG-binding domain-containing protein 7-like [Silene latifolia]|uniref:methyl-CpG-binding domain-containing protein 7-like n=1 Tax=Silene latifolia TaxID=37657 RepID=UPI003D784F07